MVSFSSDLVIIKVYLTSSIQRLGANESCGPSCSVKSKAASASGKSGFLDCCTLQVACTRGGSAAPLAERGVRSWLGGVGEISHRAEHLPCHADRTGSTDNSFSRYYLAFHTIKSHLGCRLTIVLQQPFPHPT